MEINKCILVINFHLDIVPPLYLDCLLKILKQTEKQVICIKFNILPMLSPQLLYVYKTPLNVFILDEKEKSFLLDFPYLGEKKTFHQNSINFRSLFI